MINRFKKYSANFILLVVALQILNMSVTGRITDDSSLSQVDDSVNIADHALEFIVENMLGFTNAFPEKKEIKERHTASCCQKVQVVSLFSFHPVIELFQHQVLASANYSPFVINNYSQYLLEIAHPPPKYT